MRPSLCTTQLSVYQVDIASLRAARVTGARARAFPRIAPTVWLLGFVSLFTDISSEMVSSILPAYLLIHLQLSPIEFGFVDGLYHGVTALARLASGILSDRFRRYKAIAAIGYGLSAVCKLGLLAAGNAWGLLAAVISLDRIGKGVRTAPRDAMISLSSEPGDLAATFGVHRALDTAGVVIGPLMAFLLLWLVPGGFDSVFVVSFLVALIGFGLLVLMVRQPSSRPSEDPATSSRIDVRRLARDRRFRPVLALGSLLSLTVMSDAFLYLMLQRKAALDIETIPLLYVATSVAYLSLAVPMGRLADQVGRGSVFLSGHLFIIAVYAIALLTDRLSLVGLIGCLILHGTYYAATDGVLAALASGIIPVELRASGLSALATATSIARFGGSLLLGAAWAMGGPSSVLIVGLIGTTAVLALGLVRWPMMMVTDTGETAS